ncbi:MAG: hypothetical protein IJP84_00705 [Lachnospiraceae bacterium]|nr:hypothetical protein [Lachnospiraceae bacterium]
MKTTNYSCFNEQFVENVSELGFYYSDILCNHEGTPYTVMDLQMVCALDNGVKAAVKQLLDELTAKRAQKEQALPLLSILMKEALIKGIYKKQPSHATKGMTEWSSNNYASFFGR